MGTIAELYRAVKRFDDKKETIIADIIEDHKEEIVQLNRDQLNQGLLATGTKIRPGYRSRKYAEAKNQINSLPGYGTPDLKLTGEFQRRMDLWRKGNKFYLDSRDDKVEGLAAKYGEEIFGLTNESRAKAMRIVKPEFMRKLSQMTGLKLT